jgi:hypothetical protein
MGYCPFFWMTWVSLIVFPIVFVGKTLFKLTSIPVKPVFKALSDREKAKMDELSKIPLEPSFYVILDVYRVFGDVNSFIDDYDEEITIKSCGVWVFGGEFKGERIRQWFIKNPNWRDTHLEKARIEYKEWADRTERKQKEDTELRNRRDARNRKLSATASMCGRGLFKVIIPTLILGLAVLTYYGVAKLVSMITLQGFFGAIALMFAGIASYFAMKIFLDFLFTFVFTDNVKDKISTMFEKILGHGGIYDKFIGRIHDAWFFVKDTVALTYKAECPLIQWGDETGKITKRENSKNSN